MSRAFATILIAGLTIGVVACSDDEGGTGPTDNSGFASVQTVLSTNECRNCHNSSNSVFHGALELENDRAADSAVINNYLDFETPANSPLIQRPLLNSALAHPVRPFDSATDADVQTIVAYVQALATAGATRTLTAAKVTGAPAIDGVADAAWNTVQGIQMPIHGGFAGDITVTMKAMYIPNDRIFFLLQWDDPTESVARTPWLKTASGWLKQSVAAPTFNNSILANWRTMPADYRYEDKLAIIWNTTGASAVEGFDENGCAVLCHVNRPGDPRPLKYTNAIGQTADMWHWKLVRTNAVRHLDDQYVYWNRSTSVNSAAGRAGDPGGGEYASNGSTLPSKMSPNQPAPPYFMVDSATAVAWAAAGLTIDPGDITTAFVDNFAVGDQVANAITTLKPNVDRSHIEAFGAWSAGRWTLEMGRLLTTNSVGTIPAGGTATVPVDVQFSATSAFRFGVAVFDNAQIEHSWSPAVYTLRFQQ